MKTQAVLDKIAARPRIGIIAGSGPEAGVDLWNKVLLANKRLMGQAFTGDLDAPCVAVLSEPGLGLSMELERHEAVVWERLAAAATAISPLCDHYAIACNTLNWFSERLQGLGLSASLAAFQDVAADWVRANNVDRVCLLGARQTMSLGPWSAYRRLPEAARVETVSGDALHRIVYDIKVHGGDGPGIAARFQEILAGVESDVVLLACTELPLIRNVDTDKTLLDVTELVAERLARLSLGGPGA